MDSLRSLIDELQELLGPSDDLNDEPQALAEFVAFGLELDETLFESKMDPFKRKSRLGPGPYGHRNVKRKSDRFKCKCTSQGGGSLCKCKSKSRRKTVYVSYDYKNSYNAVYRAWLRKRKKSKKKRQSFQMKAKIG